jgi:CRP/FNR family cyclic AMP-dependent transcriptional regulator
VRGIEALMEEIPALAGLAPEHRALIAGCGTNAVIEDGEHLFRESDPADTFYAIRRGAVALEFPIRGSDKMVIETLTEGDVIGWSWLFPPHRIRFDARAIGDLHVITFDGACLRGKCQEDHDLGYELMERFAEIIIERLQATRMRLLDIYGTPVEGA